MNPSGKHSETPFLVDKALTDSLRKSIFETLGYYDFRDDPYIKIPSASDASFIQSTIQHENTHRYLCGSTTFGAFQRFLVITSKEYPSLPESTIYNIDRLFELSLDSSLLVHEGAATYQQIHYISLVRSEREGMSYLNDMPPIYQQGYKEFAEIVQAVVPSEVKRYSGCEGIAEALLDTNVMELLGHIWEQDVSAIVDEINLNSPQRRLDLLKAYISNENDAALLNASISDEYNRQSDELKNIHLVIRRQINEHVMPVYGVSDETHVSRRVAELFRLQTKLAKKKGINGFDGIEVEEIARGDRSKVESNVNFYSDEKINSGFMVLDQNIEFARLLEFLLEIGRNNIMYVHLFDPARNRLRNTPLQKVQCTREQSRICVTIYYPAERDVDSVAFSIGNENIVSLMLELSQQHTTICACHSDFLLDKSSSTEFSRIALRKLEQSMTVFYYRESFSFSRELQLLKEVSCGNKVEVSSYYYRPLDCFFIFIFSEKRNLCVCAPINGQTLEELDGPTADDLSILRRGSSAMNSFPRGVTDAIVDHLVEFQF